MVFIKTNTLFQCEPKVYVFGEVIQTVTYFKYLGIILDTSQKPSEKGNANN